VADMTTLCVCVCVCVWLQVGTDVTRICKLSPEGGSVIYTTRSSWYVYGSHESTNLATAFVYNSGQTVRVPSASAERIDVPSL
jgi:hypothetical protein